MAARIRARSRCRANELAKLDREDAERRVAQIVEDHFRPEMRRMERFLLLQILDTAWKEHLLAMDHLRSSVNLRGYAQIDPKVEYKREGMKLFDAMWVSVGRSVTDLIFKMEQLDEGFVGSTWVESAAIKEDAPAASDIARQQQAAIAGTEGERRRLSRSATAWRRSAATSLARAAAGRSTRIAAWKGERGMKFGLAFTRFACE